MTTLSGNFVTKVSEGPYAKVKDWWKEMEAVARDHGSEPGEIYFFFTTCPKCTRHYDKNYVVGVVQV